MIGEVIDQNAHWFLMSRVVPAWMTLASTDGLSQKERQTVLAGPAAISLLPEFDERAQISVDIDFYWEDKNWIGRLIILKWRAGTLADPFCDGGRSS